jgi:hypothetical protein
LLAATLNVDGLGTKAIRKQGNAALEPGDISEDQILLVAYNSENDVFDLILADVLGLLDRHNTWEQAQTVEMLDRGNQSGATSTNSAQSNVFRIRVTGNITLSNPSNLVSGKTLIWIIINSSGSASRTISYGNKFRFPAGIQVGDLPGGATSVITGVYNGEEDVIYCSFLNQMEQP